MIRLPSLTGQKVIKALVKAGFEVVRQRGSHVYLRHADGRATLVPVHRGETIGRGLMAKILKESELDREEFLKLV
ncbi:MAG: type II toxin-antitoxin system HicA family toxin [Chloroflexi bacterium]|nr:type II toxin-antitoxin system HicA family toxin [Chloroflexota bacterium]